MPAQDEASCVIDGVPEEAVLRGGAEQSVALRIAKRVSRRTAQAQALPVSSLTEGRVFG